MLLDYYYTGLSTRRLYFRKLTYDDIASWREFYEENANIGYLGFDTSRSNQEMAESWIESQLSRYQNEEFGQLAMISKQTGELIGTRGFSLIHDQGKVFFQSMGSVKPKYWRQGYASESAIGMYHFLFHQNITDTIISLCHVENIPSQKNLQKLGFVIMDCVMANGRDIYYYVLTKEVWSRQFSCDFKLIT